MSEIKKDEDNIRNLNKVWEENRRLKECIEVLIKLIEECKLEIKKKK